MDAIIGIDLGTTNSEVAILENDVATIVEENGKSILPSVAGFAPDGKLLVGTPALNQLLVYPEQTVRSIKRRMGRVEKVVVAGREYRPAEISAIILRRLKERAERRLSAPVHKAVITIPAFFDEAQRRATTEAGELAGMEVVRLLHEPTAATLVYDSDLSKPRKVLVYDLGGGTFDVSIAEIQDGLTEVLASHGDTELGGDDFDELLLDHVLTRFEEESELDVRDSARVIGRLRVAVEKAKRRLSFHPFVTVEEEFLVESKGTPLHLSIEIERAEYENLIRPIVERSMTSVQTALNQAGLLLKDLDSVLLVGGSTRTPLVSNELELRTGVTPRQDIHPDLCVALGAAVQAGMIAGCNVGRTLVDVSAHSVGISCVGVTPDVGFSVDHFSRIIPRNSPLPTTRSHVYATTVDDQAAANIEVFQGEDDIASNNTRLDGFRVAGLDEDASEGNPIVVQFNLTLDGTLTVTAKEKNTGISKRVVIESAEAGRASRPLPPEISGAFETPALAPPHAS